MAGLGLQSNMDITKLQTDIFNKKLLTVFFLLS